MKTRDEVYRLLDAFGKKFGYQVLDAQQGSEAWFNLKLGVISASNVYRAIAKKDSETRATYMAELVAQVCTGIMEEVSTKHMEWGQAHEKAARSAYELESGLTIVEVPFVFKDETFREGCSPDGLVSLTKGAEIKCPWNSTNFIKWLVDDKIKMEYQYQVQYAMRITGANEWDYGQYDPRMKKSSIKWATVERDPKVQARFDEAIPEFIHDMDLMLAQIGVKFGDQWIRLAPRKQVGA